MILLGPEPHQTDQETGTGKDPSVSKVLVPACCGQVRKPTPLSPVLTQTGLSTTSLSLMDKPTPPPPPPPLCVLLTQTSRTESSFSACLLFYFLFCPFWAWWSMFGTHDHAQLPSSHLRRIHDILANFKRIGTVGGCLRDTQGVHLEGLLWGTIWGAAWYSSGRRS